MIRVSTHREPVTVTLPPPYSDVTVTLKRLTSIDYGEARHAAQATIRDTGALLELLIKHDRLPPGGIRAWKTMKDKDPAGYANFMSGVGGWLAAVEGGLRGIEAWTGVVDGGGQPALIDRETLEVLMLDEGLCAQLMGELDRTARILLTEGELFGT